MDDQASDAMRPLGPQGAGPSGLPDAHRVLNQGDPSTLSPELPGRDGRRRLRWWHAVIASALVLCGVAGVVAVRALHRAEPKDDPQTAAAAIIESVRTQSVISFQASWFNASGLESDGRFTVTGDGDAAGTINESFAGRADYVADESRVAVRGDQAFWERHTPSQTSALKDRWVQPDDGGFPVRVASDLGPDGLASVVQHVMQRGRPITEEQTFGGKPVDGFSNGEWTVLFTRERPHKLVWLGGPLDALSPVRPIAWAPAGPRPAFVTATASTQRVFVDRLTQDPVGVPTPPYLSITPTTPEEAAEQKTRQARAAVLPSLSADAGTANPNPGLAAQAPPKQSAVVTQVPVFEAQVNAKTCTGNTCSWTVTVTNTGNAAGEATVVASASPGMAPRTISVGILNPGQSRTTPVMTFPNPAPAVAGRSTSVTVSYAADVLTSQSTSSTSGLVSRLRRRHLEPTGSRVLKNLDPAEVPTVMKALDLMSSVPGYDRDQVMAAAENAVNMAALPELQALVDSGRLENPEVLAEKFRNLTYEYGNFSGNPDPEDNKIGYRRELQAGADALRRYTNARVKIDGVERTGGRDYGADVLIKMVEAGHPKTIALQVKSVNSSRMIANLSKALKQLNGRGGVDATLGVAEEAPPDSERVALIYLEPPAGPMHVADRTALERRLFRDRSNFLSDWCVNGKSQADEIVMVNQAGTHRWTKEQVNALLHITCA